MAGTAAEAQLAALRQLLAPLGRADCVDHSVLHPGHRREQLIRGIVSGILGGVGMDDVPCGRQAALDGLAEDERFAEKCRALLAMLDVPATAEQIRGCSGSQEEDTALLLRLARLLQAMQQQRGADDSGTGVQPRPAPPDTAVAQLLGHAASNVAKLTSEALQLFASDMSDVLAAYADQGALQYLARLQQQAAMRAEELQGQLDRLLAPGNGCAGAEGCGGELWREQVANAEAALRRLLEEVKAFDLIYQQELSVWAEVASEQQQQQQQQGLADHLRAGGGAQTTAQAAESTGQAARRIVAAYRALCAVLDGFANIKGQYQALQNVPIAVLQEQRAAHSSEAQLFRSAATILRASAKI